MNTTEEKLPDEKVKIKLSICGKCSGIVRAAVVHQMTVKSRNSFMKEVMQYNLSVKEIPLLEYRENKIPWCSCKQSPKIYH